ncbi:FAD-dependent oxidoreductase [Actinoplanes sp. KI2]|uniref:NAD(P)/FAD-dependent oxidoreductase n=1 Tax=Actinoplanes sp. KI2 TaxID=2983315 RepID=UPI0021D605B1|nr:FAD-dependent oxidoreductase [Actinoplanes sp. KI2]MCU7727450.1 FAD-dependent oxidoreductase [Actinoplanes sp. KI2]
MRNIVVAGAGLAGLRTVQELRNQGFAGTLTLVGAEPHRPYDRPPLSKAVLAGESGPVELPADWAQLDCEVLLGRRAESLALHADRPGGTLHTTGGPLPFDGLAVATGASPIRLPGPGAQHVVRTLDDCRALAPELRAGARVVIVGAGFIGAEVATVAAGRGCRVTVVEAADAPLAGALGSAAGALTTGWYAEAGVELRCGIRVAAVEDGGLALVGGEMPADVVIAAVGVRPDVGWLAGSGLAVERGLLVDGAMRTSRPEVVAAGDCAAWWSRRFGCRLPAEHWTLAKDAPEVAAATLLGREAVYDAPPYFWSEQFGRMVQYAGHHRGADRMVLRGDPADPSWAALWLTGSRLDAILAVDRPRDLVQGRRLIADAAELDPDRAADPQVMLRNAVGVRC